MDFRCNHVAGSLMSLNIYNSYALQMINQQTWLAAFISAAFAAKRTEPTWSRTTGYWTYKSYVVTYFSYLLIVLVYICIY